MKSYREGEKFSRETGIRRIEETETGFFKPGFSEQAPERLNQARNNIADSQQILRFFADNRRKLYYSRA